MIDRDAMISNMIQLCQKPSDTDDYMENGLLYCGRCKTPKQCRHIIFGQIRILPCLCECGQRDYEMQAEKRRKSEEMSYIMRLKTQGVQDKQIRKWTFANDDNSNPKMTDKAMRYYSKWQQMYSDNIGLLLWGNVGTGKTYFAACIANALLENRIPVLMTNFAKIINAMSNFSTGDKNEYLNSLNKYKLLIIDDLGAERQSDYAQEIVYSVIDARYKNGQPIIITTNMTIDEIKAPSNITYSRIYDRVLEMCAPIYFSGESRRKQAYQNKIDKARTLFSD